MITRWLPPPLPARLGGRRLSADPAEVVGASTTSLRPAVSGAGCPCEPYSRASL